MCPNHLYAKVGGIPMTELNTLEREFLRMIDWRLVVSTLFNFLLVKWGERRTTLHNVRSFI